MVVYVPVTNGKSEEAIDIPVEDNNTILLSTIQAVYSNATGLKYIPKDSKNFRALKVSEGVIYPPEDQWPEDIIFNIVFDETDKKNKKDQLCAGMSNLKIKSEDANSNLDHDGEKTDLAILGLPLHITDEKLKSYFETFGEVEFASIKKHKDSGKSKGFGFLRFVANESAMKALVKRHVIGNKLVDVQISESTKKLHANDDLKQKIYISGLSKNTTEKSLREHFEKFGSIEKIYCPKPFHNYAFVTFTSSSVAQKLIEDRILDIDNVKVNIMEAKPKQDFYNNSNRYNKYQFGRYNQTNNGRAHPSTSGNDNHSINPWMRNNYQQQYNQDLVEAVVNRAVTDVILSTMKTQVWNNRR